MDATQLEAFFAAALDADCAEVITEFDGLTVVEIYEPSVTA